MDSPLKTTNWKLVVICRLGITAGQPFGGHIYFENHPTKTDLEYIPKNDASFVVTIRLIDRQGVHSEWRVNPERIPGGELVFNPDGITEAGWFKTATLPFAHMADHAGPHNLEIYCFEFPHGFRICEKLVPIDVQPTEPS